jgi:predicted DCC family thiol-disulfide oxidoreductase YuxK
MQLAATDAYSYRRDVAVPAFDDRTPIVFMDAECALCVRGARIIARLDRAGEFRICPVQSPLGRRLLGHYGLDAGDPESWLYLADGRAYTSLDAMIRAGRRLGGSGHLLAPLSLLPRGVQDWLYGHLARSRYRLFGRADLCAVPDPRIKQRLMLAVMPGDAAQAAAAPEPRPGLFQRALGPLWNELPPAVRRLHSVCGEETFAGRATITRGDGRLARVLAWLFGFPAAGTDVPVSVAKRCTPDGEVWTRDFGGHVFRSHLTAARRPGCVNERFSIFTFEIALPVREGRLHFPVRRGWVLGIPLPAALLPGSEATEAEVAGVFNFDVALTAPLGGGLIVRYRGTLVPGKRPQVPPL